MFDSSTNVASNSHFPEEGIDPACIPLSPVVDIAAERAIRRSIVPVQEKNKSSYLWKIIWRLANGALPNANKSQCEYVCKLCYDACLPGAPDRVFQRCLVALHNDNISNMLSHVKGHHRIWLAANRPQASVSKPQLLSTAPSNVQGNTPSSMALFVERGNTAVMQRVHALTARLVVNKHLPLTLATEEEYNDVIQAATHLKPGSYLPMTTFKMNACLAFMFASFVSAVSAQIVATRALHVPSDWDGELHGSPPGWITVCHDGWDSTIKHFFGVSVYWINPHSFKRYQLALGLAVPTGHSASECNEAAIAVLRRYGISKRDIFVSVNDTTNASVATGRLLAGEGGNCTMHMANLVCEHATGKRKCSARSVVVDEFPACENLRKKVVHCVTRIFTKMAKSRALTYKNRNAQVGMQTIRIGLPNDTRISGTQLMFQNFLRSMYSMHIYFSQEPPAIQASCQLTQDDWRKLAGFEAVMRPICDLSFAAQIDSRPSASLSWLNIMKCKLDTAKKSLMVVDVEFADDDKLKWDARTQFKNLRKKKIAIDQLPSPVGELQVRLLKELEVYFPSPSDHQCIAMALDPVMLTTGLPLMRALGYTDLVNRCMTLLKDAVEDEASRAWDPSMAPPIPLEPDPNSSDEEDVIKKAMRTCAATQIPHVEETYVQQAECALNSWTKQHISWNSFLTNGQKLVLTDEDALKAASGDCYFLAEKVDVLLWWRLNGDKYRLIRRIAARELAIPDSNGLQERVFSFCKLVDKPQRQRLGMEKFEMLCILAFNKTFVAEFDGDKSLTLDSIVESLDSATSPAGAVKVLTEFFD